jgi:hypothetical protein
VEIGKSYLWGFPGLHRETTLKYIYIYLYVYIIRQFEQRQGTLSCWDRLLWKLLLGNKIEFEFYFSKNVEDMKPGSNLKWFIRASQVYLTKHLKLVTSCFTCLYFDHTVTDNNQTNTCSSFSPNQHEPNKCPLPQIIMDDNRWHKDC